MPERTLKSGVTVRTRIVPTYALVQVGAQFKEPQAPKVAVKSVAGHTEMVTAPDDSPEWDAFAQALADYKTNTRKAKDDFIYDYAIEAWRNGSGDWQTDPPDSWQFPAIFQAHGIQPSAIRRADYIRYELLKTNDDVSAVIEDALGNTAPITDAEVDAALGGFRGDAAGSAHSRQQTKRHKGR